MLRSADRLSCEEVCERMDAWIDGDLDGSLAEEVRRHIGACSECRIEHSLAEQVRESLRGLPVLDPPPRVLDGIKRKTGRNTGLQGVVGWLSHSVVRPVPAAAAVVLAVLLLAVVVPDRREPPSSLTAAEVEAITGETRLAFAYLGVAARKAEARVKASVVEDREAISRMYEVSTSLDRVLGPEAGTEEHVKNEGSL